MNRSLNRECVTGALVRFWYLSHYKIISLCELRSLGSDLTVHANPVARTLKKLRTSKGDYCIKQ